jgi:hypothetical protein
VLRKEQELGESSRKGESADFWKWLWSINAPPVVKNFAWRISHDLLPTKHNLFRRQIASDPLCPVCLTEPETLAHILWSCPSSIAVWQEGSRRVPKLLIFSTDGMDWLQQLRDRLDGEEMLEALSMARGIWLRSIKTISADSTSTIANKGMTTQDPPHVKEPTHDGYSTRKVPAASLSSPAINASALLHYADKEKACKESIPTRKLSIHHQRNNIQISNL